jgi:hypothetical protein
VKKWGLGQNGRNVTIPVVRRAIRDHFGHVGLCTSGIGHAFRGYVDRRIRETRHRLPSVAEILNRLRLRENLVDGEAQLGKYLRHDKVTEAIQARTLETTC